MTWFPCAGRKRCGAGPGPSRPVCSRAPVVLPGAFVSDAETNVRAMKVAMPKVWDERHDRADRQWAAEAVWAAMDDHRRAAALLAVGSRLVELLGSLEAWVPSSITLRPTESGKEKAQALEVSFTLVLPAVTDREASDLTEAERARLAVVKELAGIAQQLGER